MFETTNLDAQTTSLDFEHQQDFERQMLANLEVMSRTRKGISDTSSSQDKPKLTTEGEELASKTEQNFRNGLRIVWERRHDKFSNVAELKSFIESLAKTVSKGLLPKGQGLWRTWETKFKQTPVHELPKALEEFYQQFYERLQTINDPITTAAWVEQRFDSQIHALADGSGRTTKLLSAWVLLNNHHPLPHYRNREEYYQNINQSFSEWERYYRSLFTEQGTHQ